MNFIEQKLCSQGQTQIPICRRRTLGTQKATAERERGLSGTCGPEQWQHQPSASAKRPAHWGWIPCRNEKPEWSPIRCPGAVRWKTKWQVACWVEVLKKNCRKNGSIPILPANSTPSTGLKGVPAKSSDRLVPKFNVMILSSPFNSLPPYIPILSPTSPFLFASLPPPSLSLIYQLTNSCNNGILGLHVSSEWVYLKSPISARTSLYLITILTGNLIYFRELVVYSFETVCLKYFPPSLSLNFSHQDPHKIFLLPWDRPLFTKCQVPFLLEQVCYSLISFSRMKTSSSDKSSWKVLSKLWLLIALFRH